MNSLTHLKNTTGVQSFDAYRVIVPQHQQHPLTRKTVSLTISTLASAVKLVKIVMEGTMTMLGVMVIVKVVVENVEAVLRSAKLDVQTKGLFCAVTMLVQVTQMKVKMMAE